MSNSRRRTDLRKGSIDLRTMVSNPDSMINEDGKLVLPTGTIPENLLEFLNQLFITLVNSSIANINNVTNIDLISKALQADRIIDGSSETTGYLLSPNLPTTIGKATHPIESISTKTLYITEDNSIHISGLKISFDSGNIVVKDENDATLAILNDSILEENIKTAIITDNSPNSLKQQILAEIGTGSNGKSAFELWQDSQEDPTLTLDDFWAYLEGDQGPAGADGLSIRFLGRIVFVEQSNVVQDGHMTDQERNAVYLASDPSNLYFPQEGDLVLFPDSTLNYFDGTEWQDYGSIKGDDGADGQQGLAGQDADPAEVATELAAIQSFRSSLAQDLVDSHADELRGLAGSDGERGQAGEAGPQGPAGVPLDILIVSDSSVLTSLTHQDTPINTIAIVGEHFHTENNEYIYNAIYKKVSPYVDSTNSGWAYQYQSLKGDKGADGADGTSPTVADVATQLATAHTDALRGQDGEAGQDGETPIAKTFVFTVEGGKFHIDGVESPTLTLFYGQTYKFDVRNLYVRQSSSTHPVAFQTDLNDDSTIISLNPDDDYIVTYKVDDSLPSTLFYRCLQHPAMQGDVTLFNLIPSELKGADGTNGTDGVSPTPAEVSNDLITNHIDAIKGPKGDDGNDGVQGIQGIGIDTITLDNDNLVIGLTDDTTLPLGPIRGPQGEPGAPGDPGQDGTATKYLLRVDYSNTGIPTNASFQTLSGFQTQASENVSLSVIDDNSGSPHTVDLFFPQETSPPISTMIYGYNAPASLYNVFNHHDSNLTQILPAAYSSPEQLFSNYDNSNTSLTIPVNTSATKSSAQAFPPLTTHAFIVISF